MDALSKTVVIVTMEVEPDWEDELNRWYEEEHIEALLSVPGYLSAERFLAVDGTPKYMAFYQVESPAAFHSNEHELAVSTPWTERMRPHFQAQIAIYEQTFPADGLYRGPAWTESATPGGIMVFRVSVLPEHEAGLDAWYNEEHLPALCSVPGVIAGRRFKAVEGEPGYMARYDLTEPEVQTTEAWSKAAETPWTHEVRKTHRDRWRVVYRPLSARSADSLVAAASSAVPSTRGDEARHG